jgi:O-antigen/teichoic acid export membrane protein
VNVFNLSWLVLSMRRTVPFGFHINGGLLRSQLSFGAKSYVQTLTSHMLLRSDIYMVSYFLGPAQTAFYSLALRFTEMVLEIPQAVGLVLYPRLASSPEHEIHRLTAQACRRTVLVTFICAALLVAFGPFIIVLWYGKPYAPAADPLPWAALAALAMSVFVILTRDFTSRNRQAINIAAGFPALVLNIVLNWFMIPALGIVGAAMATAISYSLACLILLSFYLPRAGLSIFDVLVANREDIAFLWDTTRRIVRRGKRAKQLRSTGTEG